MRLGAIGKNGLSDLGTVQDTGEISGAVADVGQIAAAVSGVPVVGQVAQGLAQLVALFHVGQGCGTACTTSSETEQIFECAGWDVELAATAGQITQSQAVAALQWLLQQGEQAMASLEQTDAKAAAGLTNLQKMIQAQIAAVKANKLVASDFSGEAGPSATPNSPIPISAPTATLDPTMLEESVFVQPGTSGWYANSVSQGASLALQAIADATNQVASASAAAGSIAADIEAIPGIGPIATPIVNALSSMSKTTLLLLAALGIGGWFLFSGNRVTNPNPRRKLRRRVC